MESNLSENIKALRTRHGLSQVELAGCLSVTKQCVSNWENDNVQPSVDMLVRIADYFRVSTDVLLGRDTREMLDIRGLTDEQAAHVCMIVKDLIAANARHE